MTYVIASLAILVLLGSLRQHRKKQPYYYRFQNAMESWLFASNVVLLALAMVYSAITQAAPEATAARRRCLV